MSFTPHKALLTLLLIFAAGISACEVAPTDYDDAQAVSTTELTKVVLRHGKQAISLNGLLIESFPIGPTNLLDADSLFSLRGQIDRIGEQTFLSFALDVRFPETGVFALNRFNEPQPRGFAIEIDSLELQSNWDNRHSTANCPQSAASMKLATLNHDTNLCDDPFWMSPQIIPATAQLNLDLTEEENRISGIVSISGIYRSQSGTVVFYDLQGEIEMK